MVEVEKTEEPNVLSDNKQEWTSKVLEHIRLNQDIPSSLSRKYNQEEVKGSLRMECRNKCIYCESKIGHITYEHIEHLKPKAKDKYPELTFEYENLGLACPKCNTKKGSTYDEDIPFINPYEDNPTDHFIATGSLIWAKPGDDRAKLTRIEIELNRPELLEARRDRLEKIKSLVEEYNKATNETLKKALKKEITKETNKEKPYSFFSSTLVKALLTENN